MQDSNQLDMAKTGKNWRGEWLHTPVFLPGEFHGQRSQASYSPWDCKELDTTMQPTLTFTNIHDI